MERQDALGALAALAHETRLDLFRLLVQAGPEGLAAGAVGESLDIPAATLSFHLKELKSAGLIRYERAGRSRIYSPDFDTASALIAFLTDNCCQGVPPARECRAAPRRPASRPLASRPPASGPRDSKSRVSKPPASKPRASGTRSPGRRR